MGIALLIDFGSTFTKIRAVDLQAEEIIGSTQAATTCDTDITIGLNTAYQALQKQTNIDEHSIQLRLACSSAAGGLRMVASGFVTELTAEAAKRAALGAGAKVVQVYSYKLSPDKISAMETICPDVILLAGGIDGGDEDVIVHNAKLLSMSSLASPIVVAGNQVVSEKVARILQKKGKVVRVAQNVMPEINKLDVEPCRQVIREIFTRHIVRAKGLDKAQSIVGNVIMPTPMATLNAAKLLAKGTENEAGLGELLVIEVGGATTNVHSVGSGTPSQTDFIPKGLPEPYAKRTVEGDLGIRYNANHILEIAGKQKVLDNLDSEYKNADLDRITQNLSTHVSRVPVTPLEFAIDIALSRTAVDIAVERHAGMLEIVQTATGPVKLVRGKDLTRVKTVIGTGGVFAHGPDPKLILEAALFNPSNPLSLRPQSPNLYIDCKYIFYAMGLLGEVMPDKAIRIMKRSLVAA